MRSILFLWSIVVAPCWGGVLAPASVYRGESGSALYWIKEGQAFQGHCRGKEGQSPEKCQGFLQPMPADELRTLLSEETELRIAQQNKKIEELREATKKKIAEKQSLFQNLLPGEAKALVDSLSRDLSDAERTLGELLELAELEKKVMGAIAEPRVLSFEEEPLLRRKLIMMKVADIFRSRLPVQIVFWKSFSKMVLIYPTPVDGFQRASACADYGSSPVFAEAVNGRVDRWLDEKFHYSYSNDIWKKRADSLREVLAYKKWPSDWVALGAQGYSPPNYSPFYVSAERMLWNVRSGELKMVRYFPRARTEVSAQSFDFGDKESLYVTDEALPGKEMALCWLSIPQWKDKHLYELFGLPWELAWANLGGIADLPLKGAVQPRFTYLNPELRPPRN